MFLMTVSYHIIAGQGKHSNLSNQTQICYGANLVAITSEYEAACIITSDTLLMMSGRLMTIEGLHGFPSNPDGRVPKACHMLTTENSAKNLIRIGVRKIRNTLSEPSQESLTTPIGIPDPYVITLVVKMVIDHFTEMMLRGHGVKPNKGMIA
jgi:hypothetical protein